MKNEFKMSLFAAPISPVKDSLTGRVSRPATVYPSREVTLQEVVRLITGDPALERLTRQLRLPLETGDKERFSELKRQTLPYVTPCGTFSYRKSDRLLAPSGLVVVDVEDWTLPRRRSPPKTAVRRCLPMPRPLLHQPERTRRKGFRPLSGTSRKRDTRLYLRAYPRRNELRGICVWRRRDARLPESRPERQRHRPLLFPMS